MFFVQTFRICRPICVVAQRFDNYPVFLFEKMSLIRDFYYTFVKILILQHIVLTVYMPMKRQLLSALAAAAVFASAASDIDFTYNTAGAEPGGFGFRKTETYDVAIHITDPTVVGTKVKGLSVYLPVTAEGVIDLSGWLATELKLMDKKNAPDLASAEATLTNYTLSATFDTPVEITEAGIWAGYSFTINGLDAAYGFPGNPVAIVSSAQNRDKGLWMHTSRTRLKWADLGTVQKAVSPMVVHLQSQFGDNDVAVTVAGEVYLVRGNEGTLPATLVNHGAEPVSDIEYSYSFGTVSGSGSYRLEEPLATGGRTTTVALPVSAAPEFGKYSLSLTVDKNNGAVNNDPNRTAAGTVNVWPKIPVNRPLVEEYTGLNCGFCPRGYVAMEYMKEKLGDDFVALAFHSSAFETAMATVQNYDFPVAVTGFPAADINRAAIMDPANIPYEWDDYAESICNADISLGIRWADEDCNKIELTSELTFMEDFDASACRLTFALVGDNLHNIMWMQENNYAGQKKGDGVETPIWDLFLKGGSLVPGLIFNDVVVYYKDIKGIEGSVPEKAECNRTYTYSYTVDVKDIRNLIGERFLNADATLHGVVALVDTATGHAVNSCRSASLNYSDSPAGVGAISAGATVEASEFFNMQGMAVPQPGAGMFIRRDRMSDGTVRTAKVVLR